MSPVARLVQQGHPKSEKLHDMIVSEGLDVQRLSKFGLMEEHGEEAYFEVEEPSYQDEMDVRSFIIPLFQRLDGRPLCREELDDHMRAMGRRKIKRPGMVIQTLRMAARLAHLGISALEFKSERLDGYVTWVANPRHKGSLHYF